MRLRVVFTGLNCIRWLLLAAPPFCLTACNNPDAPRAVGTLEWNRIELVAEAAEPVVAIHKKEGDALTAGDVILELDASRLKAQLFSLQAARDQAAARVAELERGPRVERINESRARVTGAKKSLEIRQRELLRVSDLERKKLSSPEALDLANARQNEAYTEVERAQAELDELLAGTTDEELDQARSALQHAQAMHDELAITVDRMTVRAPVPGQLDDLPYKIGERPAVNNVVAVMLGGALPYARVYVPETVRVHITPGTAAQVFIDGIEQPFAGKVRKISSDPAFTPFYALTEYDRGRTSYVAEVDLAAPDRQLPAGVPVEVVFDIKVNGPGQTP
jgi:HlyD family secretion protein